MRENTSESAFQKALLHHDQRKKSLISCLSDVDAGYILHMMQKIRSRPQIREAEDARVNLTE